VNEWWERGYVEVHRRATCWFCEAPLAGKEIFVPWGAQGSYRGRPQSVHAMQVCWLCLMHESARVEAKDDGRRFVDIEFERCRCGRAQLSSIGECITCRRERRMLDRQWAEIKLARRILSSIRKEIKVGKAALDGGTSGASV
jgi:hypothetical protein